MSGRASAPRPSAPWAQLAWKGHADDALVLVGAAVMVTALTAKRHRWLLPGWVIAVAGKPTALALAPLLLASSLWLVCVAVTRRDLGAVRPVVCSPVSAHVRARAATTMRRRRDRRGWP